MAVIAPDDFPKKAFDEASVVILVGYFTEETLERIAKVEKPVLSLQFRYRQFPFSSVCVDNEMAGYLVTRHLIEADCDNAYLMLDSTIVKAHQQAITGKGGGGDQAMGRSRGELTTKIHLVTDSAGRPLRFILTQGQAADITSHPIYWQA